MKRNALRKYLNWQTIGALSGAVVALLWMYRRVVVGRVLANGDLHTYFFPYWVAAARAFQSGEVPLWNPYLFAGAPLLANSQVGCFYPLNWLLWRLSGPALADIAAALHGSVLIHLGLALINMTILARRLGCGPWGGALAGLLYAGGGYLGGHVDHVNQLQGMAWMPLVLLPSRRGTGPSVVSVVALALILLAGHTQTAFITVLGVGVWWAVRLGVQEIQAVKVESPSGERRLTVSCGVSYARRLIITLWPFSLAGLMAAAQLLPTFELSRLAVRAGGLPWREAISFSIKPWELHRVLLPPYLLSSVGPEGIAYVGVVGLGLALWGGVWAVRQRDAVSLSALILGGLGVGLALGGYNPLYLLAVRLGVPGFIHFRAPARFLSLYTLATALLAGLAMSRLNADVGLALGRRWGAQSEWRKGGSVVGRILIMLLIVGELWGSAEYLPHAQATAQRAYTDIRPATAHLLAATQAAEARGEVPGRFLSISQMLFEAGDKAAMETVYGPVLSPSALWSYIVAAKAREVLSPNLPLAFEVPAVDGYDGGLLPMVPYVEFSRLLIPEGTLDGRLRENLVRGTRAQIPDVRWLSLLGARFLITDKTADTWADGVFYDRQFQQTLEPGEQVRLGWLPAEFEADALGILYQGAGEVEVALADGRALTFALPAAPARETPFRVRWSAPTVPETIVFNATDVMTLTGGSLLDERVEAFYPLVLSEHFRLVHSGDVKIYENLHVLPRAFAVHACLTAPHTGALRTLMAEREFDPATQVALVDADAQGRCDTVPEVFGLEDQVHVVTYTHTQVVLEVHMEHPGFVVLTDAWYPSWHCHVTPLEPEGNSEAEVDCLPADLLFRAVYVPAGTWRITQTYVPNRLFLGIMGSGTGVLAWVIWGRTVTRRKENEDATTLS